MTTDFPSHTGRRKTRVALTQAEIQRRHRHGTQAQRNVAREVYAPMPHCLNCGQIQGHHSRSCPDGDMWKEHTWAMPITMPPEKPETKDDRQFLLFPEWEVK